MAWLFKNVLSARVLFGHLFTVFLLVTVAVGLLIYLVIPLLLWTLFGEGEISAKADRLPLVIFSYTVLPLLIGIAFFCFKFMQKSKHSNFSKAKSYLIAGVALLLLYPFRLALIGFVINICISISRW